MKKTPYYKCANAVQKNKETVAQDCWPGLGFFVNTLHLGPWRFEANNFSIFCVFTVKFNGDHKSAIIEVRKKISLSIVIGAIFNKFYLLNKCNFCNLFSLKGLSKMAVDL
jgi:hypothetical protein